jgi:hypothetical protein
MENWKDIVELSFKTKIKLLEKGFFLCFLINWQTPMPDVMLEFLNTFLIKGTNIYFGHKDKVYVISK